MGCAVVLFTSAAAGAVRTRSAPGSGSVDGSLFAYGFAYGFAYETGDDIAQHRVDVFTETYPDVDISFSESGTDDTQGLLSARASDDPPDLVYLARNQVGSYIARGVLSPLDDCVESQGVDLSLYYQAGLEQVTVDDTLFAMSEFFNTRVWILNNRVFDEAGVDPMTVDLSDWDALVALNEQLTTTEGVRSPASGSIRVCPSSCRCGRGPTTHR